jgi:hypothetical protein
MKLFHYNKDLMQLKILHNLLLEPFLKLNYCCTRMSEAGRQGGARR